MFVHYRTQGIFLKKIARGESDQLFTIFTRDFGKLSVLGRSIRKIASKLRSGADLFYLSEIEFIQGKVYKTLTDAIPIEHFYSQMRNLRKTAVINKVARSCANLTRERESDENIWELLNETFYRVNNSKENTVSLLAYYFFCWNLASFLGYKPDLYHCFYCHKMIKPGRFYFSPSSGGLMCDDCYDEKAKKAVSLKKDCRLINMETVKILRIILEGDWQVVLRLKIDESHQRQLKEMSEHFISTLPAHPEE